jgi:hypothetical protein
MQLSIRYYRALKLLFNIFKLKWPFPSLV